MRHKEKLNGDDPYHSSVASAIGAQATRAQALRPWHCVLGKVKARVPSTVSPDPARDTQHGRRHAGKRFSAFWSRRPQPRERESMGTPAEPVCPICQEAYDSRVPMLRPMLLPCAGFHELCRGCLTDLLLRAQQERLGYGPRFTGAFKCPICRDVIPGDSRFYENWSLVAMLERAASSAGGGGAGGGAASSAGGGGAGGGAGPQELFNGGWRRSLSSSGSEPASAPTLGPSSLGAGDGGAGKDTWLVLTRIFVFLASAPSRWHFRYSRYLWTFPRSCTLRAPPSRETVLLCSKTPPPFRLEPGLRGSYGSCGCAV